MPILQVAVAQLQDIPEVQGYAMKSRTKSAVKYWASRTGARESCNCLAYRCCEEMRLAHRRT